MLKRKSLLLAVLSIFVMVGMAGAANLALIKVTSEPIRQFALSDKAGGLTFEWDAGTTLVSGDIITGDLPLNVTIAREIDLEVSDGGSATPFTAANIVGADSTFCPLTIVRDGVAGNNDEATVGAGIYFRVFGAVGSQRVTIQVLGAVGDSVTPGNDPNDKIILTILDQKTNTTHWTNDGIWIDDNADDTYDVEAPLADNTLCINVSQYQGQTVNMSFDSKDDKFTFNPSNPEVAHIFTPLTIAFDPCKRTVGRIIMGARTGQQGNEDCVAFDNETAAGYCVNSAHGGNYVVIHSSAPFDSAQYQLELEILVNGQPGDNGVYFTNQDLLSESVTSKTLACDGVFAETTHAFATNSYYLSTGAAAVPVIPNAAECDVADAARAVRLVTATTDLGIGLNDTYIALDLPAFNYDLDEITANDVVTVRVSINKVPCGTIFSDVWEIGTFNCQVPGISTSMYFPYFTNMADGDIFWDGFVVTNISGNDGTFTITVYEKDGDVGVLPAAIAVPARGQYVNLLSLMLPTMTKQSGSGTLGDSSCWIYVSGDFSMDGFAMIANAATGESMGYLPRLPLNN